MSEELKSEISQENESGSQVADGEKRPLKRENYRFEFALFINDFLICKRGFPINGYVEGSIQTSEFKDEVDKIVELIDGDLKSKSRVYTWYHNFPETPDWDPEIMTDPLIDEGEFVLRFVVYDGGVEMISKQWDARYYPSYVRKNIDLTNMQVKINKEDRTVIYNKEKFFADHGPQLSGDLYVLKCMISDKENLIHTIQKYIYEVCSSLDGYYEKPSDYHTVVEYKTTVVKRDEDGKPIYKQKTYVDESGKEVGILDAFGNPWMVPVLEVDRSNVKKYNYNIEDENRKLYSAWGGSVAEKTRKYISELYVNPKEKYFKKRVDE